MRGRGVPPLPAPLLPPRHFCHRPANRALPPASGSAEACRGNSDTPPPRRWPALLEVGRAGMGGGGSTRCLARVPIRPQKWGAARLLQNPTPRARPSAAAPSRQRCARVGREPTYAGRREYSRMSSSKSKRLKCGSSCTTSCATAAGTSSRAQARCWAGNHASRVADTWILKAPPPRDGGGGPARVALSDGAGIGIGPAIAVAGSGKRMRAGWRLATCPATLRGCGPCGLRGRRGAACLEARLRPP